MFTWQIVQGQASKTPVVVSACPLAGTEILSASISSGSTDAAILTITQAFDASGPSRIWLTLTTAQSASLLPGAYVVQVTLASNNGSIAYGLLQVVAAPGNQPTYDVLADPAMVLMLNPELASDPAKVAALPAMLRKATETIRRYTNRMFTRRTYTEYLTPSLDGEVMLGEMPVHRVMRASRRPRTAIEITADPSVFQVAYSDFITQDLVLPAPFDVAYTGINLSGASYGVFSTTAVPFAGLTTIDDLAAAINAVSGWKATVQEDGYGRWPVSEIYCDGTSQGALNRGVQLKVFSEDVSTSNLDRRTGLFQTEIRFGGVGPRWGADWMAWGGLDVAECEGVIRVTYDAGFTTIPQTVQEAAVELAKTAFDRIGLDYALKKESTGDYSYELNDRISLSIPDPIRQDLSSFIIHRA